MSACQNVRNWLTKSVLVPVLGFLSQLKQDCEQVRQWVEEQVERPVNQWISRQENQCRKLPWWNPLRWLCTLVMIIVEVVVWIVVTVGKWVVTIVCQVVTSVVAIFVSLALGVVAWAVSFVVCLFTDPIAALKSFRDLWSIVLDAVGGILDFVQLLLGDVDGILGDLEHLTDSLASMLGWLGLLLGLLKGVIHFVRGLVNAVKDIVGALKDIVLGILGLNLCRFLRGLADLATSAGLIMLDTGFAPIALLFGAPQVAAALLIIRPLGFAVAGVRDTVNLSQLENIIISSINKAFGAGSERANRALDKVGIGIYPMGLPFHADSRRLFLSSDNRELNLRDLHRAGIIDLYALAGYASTCGGTFNNPEGEVVYAGTDLPVLYADLQTFLENGPGSVPEFHAFAITREKFRTHLETAQRKAAAIGVQLFFPTIGQIEATSREEIPLNVGEDTPPGDAVQQELFRLMGRTGIDDDLSRIPIVSHFHYVLDSRGKELFGLTSLFRPSKGITSLSGVTYRNRSPDWFFRWVLVHELGHYWGLDHENRLGGDRSVDEIMFTPSTGVGFSVKALVEYLFLGGEPRFTLDDAQTVWDWITTDGAASLLP